MVTAPMRVLLVEDDRDYAAMLVAELDAAVVEVQMVGSVAAARAELSRGQFDAVLLDLGLPDSNGLATFETLHASVPETPMVILTGNTDDGLAALAMQRGAQDYLVKGEADASVLVRALRYARERSAFRQSMLDRESHFRALVEHSYDAVTLLGPDFRILYDSRSIESLCGYTPEERVGKAVEHRLHPDDVAPVTGRLSELVQTSTPVSFSYRFQHRDGGWRWGEAVATDHLRDANIRAIVINHRDVSERKEAEEALQRSQEQLRQAQKMEAIGRLAGGVAHDFNNVLTAIFGYTDLLIDQFAIDDPRRSDVAEIRRSAERAAALTRQLLAFSRKQVMQPRLLNLNEVIRNVERLLQRLVGDDIVLQLDLARDLVAIRADPGQLEQVLMNLVANARDAMPDGGQLTLSTRNERAETAADTRPGLAPAVYAVLSVADTGTGVPVGLREHVFEPFFTTKEQGKGTGLGLATVYGIVKQTGGGVYLESEEGQGTTVLVYLPQAPGSSAISDSL
ncbi:MAG: PAS domain S-box protein [Acidobacteriota bacterium]|nr:PAS domain S-box protein [Acidobacteriota bacterium]MDQ3418483.1 PAS domain S-box protein [Acidobacteriota bacterium]